MQTKIILVEDDSALRESIAEYLTLAKLSVTCVASAIEFYQSLSTEVFDMAIVDIGLPDQSGYEVSQYLRQNTTMGIIIITAKSSIEDRVEGYRSGADLYFVKPIDCLELVAAINNLVDRMAASKKDIVSQQISSWILNKSQWSLITPDGRSIKLTGKEMTFLELLVEHRGCVVSRRSFMTALEHDHERYDSRALDALVTRLRKKIEREISGDIPIKTIHAVGYCFFAPVEIEKKLTPQEQPQA